MNEDGEAGAAGLDDLDELRALAARVEMEEIAWEHPPEELWEAIASRTGVSAPTDVQQPSAAAGAAHSDELGTRRASRRRSLPWVLGAAAAAVLVVAGVALTAGGSDEADTVASTTLDRLGRAGSGEAELVDDGGDLSLRLDTDGLDPGSGFLEVWVIDPEVTKLVSLGPLRPDGTYDLPSGLDPEDFPIVDVSVEPLDGDPTHSGDSVLRGELEF